MPSSAGPPTARVPRRKSARKLSLPAFTSDASPAVACTAPSSPTSTSATPFEISMPAVSLPSTPHQTPVDRTPVLSLFQQCVRLRAQLERVPGFADRYPFTLPAQSGGGGGLPHSQSQASFLSTSPSLSFIFDRANDAVGLVWACLRTGSALCYLFNALGERQLPLSVSTNESLDMPTSTRLKQAKHLTAKFIMALRVPPKASPSEDDDSCLWETGLGWDSEWCFTVSDLYKDDTNGLIRVMNTVDRLLQELERRNRLLPAWPPSLGDGLPGVPQPDADVVPLPSAAQFSRHSPSLIADSPNLLPASSAPDSVVASCPLARVVHELLITERNYIADLERIQAFSHVLTKYDALGRDLLHAIFANLDQVVDLQRRLLAKIEQALCPVSIPRRERCFNEQGSRTSTKVDLERQAYALGRVFSAMAAEFCIYKPYCANYPRALALVVSESQSIISVRALERPDVDQCFLDPYYSLGAFLIKPVQRICKYHLLFDELIKRIAPSSTDRAHFARKALIHARDKLRDVVAQVNDAGGHPANSQVPPTPSPETKAIPPPSVMQQTLTPSTAEAAMTSYFDPLPDSPDPALPQRVHALDRSVLDDQSRQTVPAFSERVTPLAQRTTKPIKTNAVTGQQKGPQHPIARPSMSLVPTLAPWTSRSFARTNSAPPTPTVPSSPGGVATSSATVPSSPPREPRPALVPISPENARLKGSTENGPSQSPGIQSTHARRIRRPLFSRSQTVSAGSDTPGKAKTAKPSSTITPGPNLTGSDGQRLDHASPKITSTPPVSPMLLPGPAPRPENSTGRKGFPGQPMSKRRISFSRSRSRSRTDRACAAQHPAEVQLPVSFNAQCDIGYDSARASESSSGPSAGTKNMVTTMPAADDSVMPNSAGAMMALSLVLRAQDSSTSPSPSCSEKSRRDIVSYSADTSSHPELGPLQPPVSIGPLPSPVSKPDLAFSNYDTPHAGPVLASHWPSDGWDRLSPNWPFSSSPDGSLIGGSNSGLGSTTRLDRSVPFPPSDHQLWRNYSQEPADWEKELDLLHTRLAPAQVISVDRLDQAGLNSHIVKPGSKRAPNMVGTCAPPPVPTTSTTPLPPTPSIASSLATITPQTSSTNTAKAPAPATHLASSANNPKLGTGADVQDKARSVGVPHPHESLTRSHVPRVTLDLLRALGLSLDSDSSPQEPGHKEGHHKDDALDGLPDPMQQLSLTDAWPTPTDSPTSLRAATSADDHRCRSSLSQSTSSSRLSSMEDESAGLSTPLSVAPSIEGADGLIAPFWSGPEPDFGRPKKGVSGPGGTPVSVGSYASSPYAPSMRWSGPSHLSLCMSQSASRTSGSHTSVSTGITTPMSTPAWVPTPAVSSDLHSAKVGDRKPSGVLPLAPTSWHEKIEVPLPLYALPTTHMQALDSSRSTEAEELLVYQLSSDCHTSPHVPKAQGAHGDDSHPSKQPDWEPSRMAARTDLEKPLPLPPVPIPEPEMG